MSAKLFQPTEAMNVESLVVLEYGPPGGWKTSIAQTANDPITLDFDAGIHRTKFRKQAIRFDSWGDVEEGGEWLEKAKTIVVDTVGRALDMLAMAIIADNAKLGSKTGGLSLQGYGVLKSRFTHWLKAMRSMQKDVILIAHEKEEKEGDVRYVRPDITGSSYGEVMKCADLVGYLRIINGKRVLDFNPTDSYVAKNAAGWAAMNVPSLDKSPAFLADLLADAKTKIGQVSVESAEIARQVDEWRESIGLYETPEDFTQAVGKLASLPPVLTAQLKVLINDASKSKGFTYDKSAKKFVGGAA